MRARLILVARVEAYLGSPLHDICGGGDEPWEGLPPPPAEPEMGALRMAQRSEVAPVVVWRGGTACGHWWI